MGSWQHDTALRQAATALGRQRAVVIGRRVSFSRLCTRQCHRGLSHRWAINDELLLSLEQFLVPTLTPWDLVITDNLKSHEVGGVRQAIEPPVPSCSTLPLYSPDLNPIEQFFSMLKAYLCKAAAKTIHALQHALAAVIGVCQSGKCANTSQMPLACNLIGKRSSDNSAVIMTSLFLAGHDVPAYLKDLAAIGDRVDSRESRVDLALD
jgi:hypothetical protein